jgi:ABC-type dipeptide/oligopeptide/nickel transport system permease subunit
MFRLMAGTRFTKKLLSHKGAMAGLCLIAIAIFTAVFAYALAPDASTYGNRMIPEISSKPPGFSIYLLQLKSHEQQSVSWLGRLVNGYKDIHTYIPVTDFTVKGDSIRLHRFIDDGITEPQTMALSQLTHVPQKPVRFVLGTDKFGRDMLSRLLMGVRVSLSVGCIAVAISLLIGITLGALAGYYRGRIDAVIMWLVNVVWSIPTLLLVFAITLVLGKGFWQVFIAVGLTMWVNVARLVRGQVMAVQQKEYIEAARAMGFSNSRIIIRHILPNILGPVMVLAAANFAGAIVMEAGLSFLGVGVQPPQPSWGLMIRENYNFIITSQPALALIPGVAIMLLVLAFNLLGNGLRDALAER